MTSVGRTFAGFAIAPIVPGVLIAAALLAMGEGEDARSLILANIFFGYPVAVLIGAPISLWLDRVGLKTLSVYAMAGALLGAFLFVATPLLIEALMMMQGVDNGGHVTISENVLPAAVACATVAAAAFWMIVRPDRTRAR